MLHARTNYTVDNKGSCNFTSLIYKYVQIGNVNKLY